MLQTYFDKVTAMLETVRTKEEHKLKQAASLVADCIEKNGIIHLFGCGHSHILTEEVIYRAGGLAPIHPILIEKLMLHEGAVRSSGLERQNGLAASFMEDQDIRPGEVVFVLSTSGRNPVPIDVALLAKEKGAITIGITSFAYSQSQPSRHVSGKRLYESVDLAINNYAVIGDAILTHSRIPVPFAPSSTVIGAAMINAIFAEAIGLMAEHGFEPPIFLSGNVDGADEHNNALIEKYKSRISLLA